VFERIGRQGVRGFRTVTVTVRFTNFVTLTRSHTVRDTVASEEALHGSAVELLRPFFDERENPKQRKIRLIGVRVEKLVR
jgi:DNA polymerase-4